MALAMSAGHTGLIIENWFRKLCNSDISIQDIAKVIIEFGNQFEGFIEWTDSKHVEISEDLSTVIQNDAGEDIDCTFHGMAIAVPGATYHWQLKILEADRSMNIGIVVSDFYDESTEGYSFWETLSGYSWYSGDGYIWHENQHILPGNPLQYGEGDIIDIWLDLKDYNKLSFGKNAEKDGVSCQVMQDKSYRLVVELYVDEGDQHKFKLLSFECE